MKSTLSPIKQTKSLRFQIGGGGALEIPGITSGVSEASLFFLVRRQSLLLNLFLFFTLIIIGWNTSRSGHGPHATWVVYLDNVSDSLESNHPIGLPVGGRYHRGVNEGLINSHHYGKVTVFLVRPMVHNIFSLHA